MFLFFSVALLVSACATLLEDGRKLEKKGLYLEAINKYEEALQEAPESVEAALGKTRSQEEWLRQELIVIRLTRISGNWELAKEKLKTVLHKEMQWSVFPTGLTYTAQQEELEIFIPFLLKQANKVAKTLPLKAYISLKNDEIIFATNPKSLFEKTLHEIQKLGQRDCHRKMTSEKQEAYYRKQFLRSYCPFWRPEQPIEAANIPPELFSGIDLAIEGKGTEAFDPQQLKQSLTLSLRSSPWYDANSQQMLKMKFKFSAKEQVSEELVDKVHTYITYHWVPKTIVRQKLSGKRDADASTGVRAINALFSLLTSNGRQHESAKPTDSITDNGDGTETVQTYEAEPRTEYFRYKATQIVQQMSAKWSVKMLPPPLAGAAWQSESSQRFVDFYSPIENEQISLYADPKQTKDFDSWIRESFYGQLDQLKDYLDDQWVTHFCKSSDLAMSADAALRCGRSQHELAQRKLDQWFQQEFSMGFLEAKLWLN